MTYIHIILPSIFGPRTTPPTTKKKNVWRSHSEMTIFLQFIKMLNTFRDIYNIWSDISIPEDMSYHIPSSDFFMSLTFWKQSLLAKEVSPWLWLHHLDQRLNCNKYRQTTTRLQYVSLHNRSRAVFQQLFTLRLLSNSSRYQVLTDKRQSSISTSLISSSSISTHNDIILISTRTHNMNEKVRRWFETPVPAA